MYDVHGDISCSTFYDSTKILLGVSRGKICSPLVGVMTLHLRGRSATPATLTVASLDMCQSQTGVTDHEDVFIQSG